MSTTSENARRRLGALLRSADFARVYTLTVFATIIGSPFIEAVAGYVPLVTAVVGLCGIGAGVLFSRRAEISWLRLVPTTLLIFLVWALTSVAWSTDAGMSFWRWLSTLAIAFLAVTIGHIRDTLQTVRALGDVARVLLVLSLALEVLAGILFDTAFEFLAIQGNIAQLGPIQGIFGTRNMLGFVAVIAVITFVIEWRTHSVRPEVSLASILLGTAMALLSASPTVFVVAAAVAVAAGALQLVRTADPARRAALQWGLAALVATGGIVLYALRGRIVAALGAADDLSMRTTLWDLLQFYARRRPVQGWGWFGAWAPDEQPFLTLNLLLGQRHTTALNAYMDVLLQVGWAGFVILIAFGGIALVRSWLDASQRRSPVYGWTPLLLVALATVSLFESFALFGAGWLLLVLATVRAGQSRSWRRSIRVPEPDQDLPRSQETSGSAG
ncbi:O-antigen ligase family protein [Microbacterium saccharophilum]|uniref:O-antigen ligase n=1 Tax=Microbacterium saccharophilum TaxID=1213358 RepID=A0A5C8IBJ5_9MICO|nr:MULTISPECIES: O-antigen ligase family protein [Microbacterium]TXK15654.1 O-antigen ligase family protein [Microbacterium saccharophilum]GEP47963.1 hypothetical protein MSA03_14710 [Microbacterium saccharophilum]SFI64123.1 O-antigen ligase [Microbacterium saccharophilum]